MDEDERKLAAALSAQLRATRQRRGWTQAVLAERSGVTTHYVALLETARKLPTLKTLSLLAQALGVSPGKLLDGNSAPTTWATEVSQIAATIPEPNRLLVRDLLTAAAKSRPENPAVKPRSADSDAIRPRPRKQGATGSRSRKSKVTRKHEA
jgi:transcriptional regulator with XRE-family HTH domain